MPIGGGVAGLTVSAYTVYTASLANGASMTITKNGMIQGTGASQIDNSNLIPETFKEGVTWGLMYMTGAVVTMPYIFVAAANKVRFRNASGGAIAAIAFGGIIFA